jgi:hypothetical protein
MFSTLRTLGVSIAAAALLAGAAPAPASQAPPSALAAAIAATQAAKIAYAFDVDTASSQLNWRAHFDPHATPALQLVAPPRASLSSAQQHAFDQAAAQTRGLPWCASEQMGRVAGLRLLNEGAESATFAFQPTAESAQSDQARRFAAQLRGDLTLSKGEADITRIHIYAPAPFSPMLLARVEQLDIVITCAAAPNGRRYAAEAVTQVRGNALGQAFNERSVRRTLNLAAAP